MYEYVSGKIDFLGEEYAVVDVMGIGYKIFTSYMTLKGLNIGSSTKLYTHLVVKEDDLVLYGFSSREELGMFKLLISVSGVGPKASVSLLSQYTANDLAAAIAGKDISKVTKAPGIGKKIAERIMLELKDKIDISNILSVPQAYEDTGEVSQVIEALVSLGYNFNVAASAVAKLKDTDRPIDVLIKDALKQLATM